MSTQTRNQPTHTGRAPLLRRGALAVGTLVLGVVGWAGPARAHEEDYYPDDSTVTSIPEAARNIIEESSGGGSTTLIYAGIAVLGLAGFAVLALNLVKGRSVTSTSVATDTESADDGSGTE